MKTLDIELRHLGFVNILYYHMGDVEWQDEGQHDEMKYLNIMNKQFNS